MGDGEDIGWVIPSCFDCVFKPDYIANLNSIRIHCKAKPGCHNIKHGVCVRFVPEYEGTAEGLIARYPEIGEED